MAEWLVEGIAYRTRVREQPVIHLLVLRRGSWELWCSNGRGRMANVYRGKICDQCRKLARKAISENDLYFEDVVRFI